MPPALLSLLCLCLVITEATGALAQPQQNAAPWPESYGGAEPAVELDSVERQMIATLREAMESAGARPCRPSGRLTKAARAHARQLLEKRTSQRITPGQVRREVLRAGGVDPVVIPWALASSGEPEVASRRERLTDRFGRRPPTHCGVGIARSEHRQVVVVVGVRRHLRLGPFPSRLARGSRQWLQGRLEMEYRAPSVMVTTPAGEVIEHQTMQRSGRLGAWLDFTIPGRYTVEVMATGPHGPEVLALFPVFVDVAAEATEGSEPRSAQERLRRDQGLAPAEGLYRRLNLERRRNGLQPLELDEQLCQLAVAHSRDMIRRRYFGHVSPSGRDLIERLRLAGVTTRRAAENLVRSGSAARAHRQLMESPAHRANLLDPELTHVGIGAVEREGEMVVTQIFVAW